jgi:hypothetical protein
MKRRTFLSNNPEDLKLLTLAKATMARSNSSSAAALRDNTGRTYVAIPVKSGEYEVDSLLAVLVVAKASSISGIEAIVVCGLEPAPSSISVIKSEDSGAKLYLVGEADELISL